MKRVYSPVDVTVKRYVMAPECLLAIGRLIRACAEIEDIVDLHLFRVSGIAEGKLMVLIGRVGIQSALNFARSFAKSAGGVIEEMNAACFELNEFKELLRCRNVAAHGVMLGVTEEGQIAFRTKNTVGFATSSIGVEVVCYGPKDFEMYAKLAEALIPNFEKMLQVDTLRAERQSQQLSSHPKARLPRAQSAKHPRQR